MYTHTPTSKFLVLSPIESGPEAQKFSSKKNTNKFLVLSPTESGPHSSFDDAEDSNSETAAAPTPSTYSTASAASSGFLFLGHPTSSLRARSDSCASVTSNSSAASVASSEDGNGLSASVPQLTTSPSPASLAGGFLYLGHPAPVQME